MRLAWLDGSCCVIPKLPLPSCKILSQDACSSKLSSSRPFARPRKPSQKPGGPKQSQTSSLEVSFASWLRCTLARASYGPPISSLSTAPAPRPDSSPSSSSALASPPVCGTPSTTAKCSGTRFPSASASASWAWSSSIRSRRASARSRRGTTSRMAHRLRSAQRSGPTDHGRSRSCRRCP